MRSGITINTGTRVLESSVYTCSTVHAWITVALVDVCLNMNNTLMENATIQFMYWHLFKKIYNVYFHFCNLYLIRK